MRTSLRDAVKVKVSEHAAEKINEKINFNDSCVGMDRFNAASKRPSHVSLRIFSLLTTSMVVSVLIICNLEAVIVE